MVIDLFTEAEVREEVGIRAVAAGGMRAFARRHRLSPQYVSDIVGGRRGIGTKIAKVLGLKRVVGWEEK